MFEYCYVWVGAYDVDKAAAKDRGWRKEGCAAGATVCLPTGTTYHEVQAVEGRGRIFFQPDWKFREGFLAVLDALGAEGWGVSKYTPHPGTSWTEPRQPWPIGDFLLVRESPAA